MSKRFNAAEALADIMASSENETDAEDSENEFEEFERLVDAKNAITQSDTPVDVILFPPTTVDSISDEECIDDDDLLPSSIPKEVPGRVGVRMEHSNDGVALKNRKKKCKLPVPKWTEYSKFVGESSTGNPEELKSQHPELCSKSPYELFRLYYDNGLKEMIVSETVRYAGQKNNIKFEFNSQDLDKFISIMLLTGYHSLPRERLCWNKDEDIKVPFVAEQMSRSRFSEIKKYIHLADNDKIVPGDKLYKVRSFISALNTRFQQFGVFSKYLSIDEEMVPYFGHHSAKMFLRGKPIRFGYKLWILASSSGYPLNVQVRFDMTDHHLVPSGKQSRCRFCKKNARLLCTKCKVPLHLHCEKEYHKKH